MFQKFLTDYLGYLLAALVASIAIWRITTAIRESNRKLLARGQALKAKWFELREKGDLGMRVAAFRAAKEAFVYYNEKSPPRYLSISTEGKVGYYTIGFNTRLHGDELVDAYPPRWDSDVQCEYAGLISDLSEHAHELAYYRPFGLLNSDPFPGKVFMAMLARSANRQATALLPERRPGHEHWDAKPIDIVASASHDFNALFISFDALLQRHEKGIRLLQDKIIKQPMIRSTSTDIDLVITAHASRCLNHAELGDFFRSYDQSQTDKDPLDNPTPRH